MLGWTYALAATVPLVLKETEKRYESGPERALYALWRNAGSLSDGLLTQDGRRFRVVYPGRESARAGPDFRDCVLVSETGEVLTGDVEVHRDASDWEGHGHHTDPGYNGVLLHVVLNAKRRTSSKQQSKTTAPIASIASVSHLLESSEEATAELPPSSAKSVEGASLEELLDRAGDERFLAKSRGFALELESSGPEQTIYGSLFEALGYSANRKPFRALASAVPLEAIAGLRSEPEATRLLAVRAVLLRAAGLLPRVKSDEERDRMQVLLPHLPRTGTLPGDSWRLFRVRPANHPVNRVEGAARLLDRYLDTGLARGLEKIARMGEPKSLVSAVACEPFVGGSMAREIAVNVLLPFMHAWAGIRRDGELRRAAIETYHAFPKLQENEITREMRRVLSTESSGARISGARRQQGLVALYKTMINPRRDGRSP